MALRIGVFVFFLGLGACTFHPPEPEPAVLPEITMEGLNTFGCTVAGEVYQARGGWTPPVQSYVSGSRVYLETWDRELDERFTLVINFYQDPFLMPSGNYHVFQSGSNQIGLRVQSVVNNPSFEINNIISTDSAVVTVHRLDSISGVFSGEFRFDALSDNYDTLKVTKGRFDVNLYQ